MNCTFENPCCVSVEVAGICDGLSNIIASNSICFKYDNDGCLFDS